MEGIARGTTPVKSDPIFPLHAKWKSYPFGSNQQYAISCALGKGGLTTKKKPVGKNRSFFSEPLDAKLIDSNGMISKELEDEILLKEMTSLTLGKEV